MKVGFYNCWFLYSQIPRSEGSTLPTNETAYGETCEASERESILGQEVAQTFPFRWQSKYFVVLNEVR
jgi:hypothetical protein